MCLELMRLGHFLEQLIEHAHLDRSYDIKNSHVPVFRRRLLPNEEYYCIDRVNRQYVVRNIMGGGDVRIGIEGNNGADSFSQRRQGHVISYPRAKTCMVKIGFTHSNYYEYNIYVHDSIMNCHLLILLQDGATLPHRLCWSQLLLTWGK